MSYLFFVISALLFIVGGAVVIGVYHNKVTDEAEIATTLIFMGCQV